MHLPMKNRDIKFRAWDKKDSTWIYLGMSSMLGIVDGNLRQFYTTNSGHDLDVPGLGHKEYWNPYILMQFTGLHDKNGKQIYEGDIFQSLNGRHWEVKYGEWKYWENRQLTPMFGWYAASNQAGTEAQLPIRSDEENNIEVIGNIYENPSLLQ